jgi:hypothetical protein
VALYAARARFVRDRFAVTTIRRVAADAGVDASRVTQFLRSKDELFAAVMTAPSALDRLKGPTSTSSKGWSPRT